MYQTYGDEVFREASEAISLEQLISDKLYRSLLLSLSNTETSERTNSIINEALASYELARLIDITKNGDTPT